MPRLRLPSGRPGREWGVRRACGRGRAAGPRRRRCRGQESPRRLAGPRRRRRHCPRRRGHLSQRPRRQEPRRRRPRHARHPLPHRLLHQGVHHRRDGDARGRGQDGLGRPRPQAPVVFPPGRSAGGPRSHVARPGLSSNRPGAARPALVSLAVAAGRSRPPGRAAAARPAVPHDVPVPVHDVHRRRPGRRLGGRPAVAGFRRRSACSTRWA